MDMIILKQFDHGKMAVVKPSEIRAIVELPALQVEAQELGTRTRIELVGGRCAFMVIQSPAEILAMMATNGETLRDERFAELLRLAREAIDAYGGGGTDRDGVVGRMGPLVKSLEGGQ